MYYHNIIINNLSILRDFAPGAVMTLWVMSIMEMVGVTDGYLHTVIGNALVIGGGLYYISNGMSFTHHATTERTKMKKEAINEFMKMISTELKRDEDPPPPPPPPPPSTPESLPYDNDEIRKHVEFLRKISDESDEITKMLLASVKHSQECDRIDCEYVDELLDERLGLCQTGVNVFSDDESSGSPSESLWPDNYGGGVRGRSPSRRMPGSSRNRSRSRSPCVHEFYRVVVGYDDVYNVCKKCNYETTR